MFAVLEDPDQRGLTNPVLVIRPITPLARCIHGISNQQVASDPPAAE
ncbi:hypothetical protein ACWDRB_23230 [Nonomuraea sp. NPDC003707]